MYGSVPLPGLCVSCIPLHIGVHTAAMTEGTVVQSRQRYGTPTGGTVKHLTSPHPPLSSPAGEAYLAAC